MEGENLGGEVLKRWGKLTLGSYQWQPERVEDCGDCEEWQCRQPTHRQVLTWTVRGVMISLFCVLDAGQA